MEKYKIILNLKSNIKFPQNFLEYIFNNEYIKKLDANIMRCFYGQWLHISKILL